jgi:hypothetical protein
MAKVEGVSKLLSQLKAREKARGKDASVVVGYTAATAIFVHENVEMKLQGQPRPKGRGLYWDPQGRGQAKFLEQPFRTLRPEFARIIREALSKGKTIEQALLLAGLRLQRESMMLVPVDTGALRASAFTRIE